MGHYAGIFAGAVGRERTVNLIPLLTWLLNIYFRLSGFQALLLFIHFRYGRSDYLFTLHPGTQTMRYVTLRSVTEIAPKSPFLCVNRSHTRNGFRAGAIRPTSQAVISSGLFSMVNHNSTEWRCVFHISFYIVFFQRKTLDDTYHRLFLTGVPLSPRTATAEFENQISVYAAVGV